MMVHIPKVLAPEQVARCRDVMVKAEWVDGRVTAGHQSQRVKNNLQLPETSTQARELGEMVMAALGRSALFFSAVLPKQVFPPLFNRYDAGMTFGAHVDNAIRCYLDTPLQIRTDVSATLFISDPDDYDGGELVVDRHLWPACGEASGRRHDRLSGHEPASRDADHARLAHRVILLDPEHGAQRHAAQPPVRPRHRRSSSYRTITRSIRRWSS